MATKRRSYRPLRVVLHTAVFGKAQEALHDAGLNKLVDNAAHWLGSLTDRSTKHGKLKVPRFVCVNAALHRGPLKNGTGYAAMVKTLVDAGVIEKGDDPVRGVRSTEYRIHPDLTSGATVIHTITSRTAQTLRKAGFNDDRKFPVVRRCPDAVHASQVATLRKIEVMPEAELLIKEGDHASRKLSLIDLAEMRDANLVPDEELLKESRFGRLDSPITRLWKVFRPHLRLDGEPLVGLDLKNSQPFFISLLLIRIIKAFDKAAGTPLPTLQRATLASEHAHMMKLLEVTGDDSEMLRIFLQCRCKEWTPEISQAAWSEHERYKVGVESGTLYEQLILDNHKRVTPGRRVVAKRALMKGLYGKSRRSKYWKSFQRLYPVLSDQMYYLKRARYVQAPEGYKKYAAFARLLQIIEAKYVFQVLCPALMAEGIGFLTIHDCIVVKESQKDQAHAVIVAAFAKHNLHPKLAIEPFSKYQKKMDTSAIVVEEICNTTNREDYNIIPLHETPPTQGDINGTATRRLRRDRREADHVHDVPSKGCGQPGSCTSESHELLGQCHDPQDRGGSLHSKRSDGDHSGTGDQSSEPVIPPFTKATA